MDVFWLLAAVIAATVIAWRLGRRGIAVGCALFAVLPAITLLRSLPWPVHFLGVVVGLVLVWHRYARSAGVVTRFAARTKRRAGVASTAEIWRHASPHALRRRAATVRPSLARLSRRALRKLPAADYAVLLCRAGLIRVWAGIEDVVLVFGGPRTGKTGWLASRLIDHPGAALVTSTRTDVLELCGRFRAERGPVLVFNAAGLGGIKSSITFDPLTGCCDAVTAMERATDMIGATSLRGSSGDREFWEGQARRVLAALLHAAALDGPERGGKRSMSDVMAWLSDQDKAAKEVPALLRRSQVAAFALDVQQFLDTNPNTRTSITSTVMPAVTWLNHPHAAAAAAPGGFDVAALLEQRATVFLLGGQDAIAAPLVTALTGHIAREARRLAVQRPGGRLDPPLGMFLDEAFLICPVPLESWTADMGGRGVTIYAAFQGRAQVLSRWGERDGATILNNAASVMVFGGTKDRDDLIFWSTLAGDRDEPITTTDLHGRVASRSVRKVPVVPPAQIANLPEGRVLVIRRGIAPVLGRAQMAWRRCDQVGRTIRWAEFTRRHPDVGAWLAARAAWCTTRWRRARGAVAGWVAAHWAAFAARLAMWRRWVVARLDRAGMAVLAAGGVAEAALAAVLARLTRLTWLARRGPRQVLVDPDVAVVDADAATEPLPIIPPPGVPATAPVTTAGTASTWAGPDDDPPASPAPTTPDRNGRPS